VLGKVAAAGGALRRLRATLCQRLAHFERGKAGKRVLLRFEKRGGTAKLVRSIHKRTAPVNVEGRTGGIELRVYFRGRELGKNFDSFAGRWVDGGQRHPTRSDQRDRRSTRARQPQAPNFGGCTDAAGKPVARAVRHNQRLVAPPV
jgi:hypothetical protein